MTIDAGLRDRVRDRARFACEFCEVTETDTGGELTIDHVHHCVKRKYAMARSGDMP